MTTDINLVVTPQEAATPLLLHNIVSTRLGIDANRIKHIQITRRSIDARQRQIKINLSVKAYIDEAFNSTVGSDTIEFNPLKENAPQCVIVGAGPAGLFAALQLISLGIRPVVIERGKDVDSRRLDMAAIARKGVVDPDSNYCFGEGGAGAFSDGKLYTRSKKRGSVESILRIFNAHGASENILIDAHPHIGTDKLPEVIKGIRKTIERCGGEVVFNQRVDALIINKQTNTVEGVTTNQGTTYNGPVILATGHSARDVYELLAKSGINLEPKGIAVGVRVEHPQSLIDQVMYHSPKGRGQYLPPAEYTLLTRIDDRAVYSFCMCPGGIIIPAASSPGEMVVNGMSPSNRGTKWANSGMVVEVLPEDVEGDSPLKMMHFQQSIERKFFEEADSSMNAPAQRMKDFVEGRASTSLPPTSYAPGIHSSRIDKLLPAPISSRLKKGLVEFGKKHRGYFTNDAILLGDETRTSAPVKITRDKLTLESISIKGLFPCGEGAGYAGGIVSAAIDGQNCAIAVAAYLTN